MAERVVDCAAGRGRAGKRCKIQEKSGRRCDDPTGISGRSGHCRASCPFPAAGVDALRHPRAGCRAVYLCAGLWPEHDALVGLAAARLRPALCALCAVQSGAQAPEGRARLAQRDCAVHRNRRSFCDPILPMALGVAVCTAVRGQPPAAALERGELDRAADGRGLRRPVLALLPLLLPEKERARRRKCGTGQGAQSGAAVPLGPSLARERVDDGGAESDFFIGGAEFRVQPLRIWRSDAAAHHVSAVHRIPPPCASGEADCGCGDRHARR